MCWLPLCRHKHRILLLHNHSIVITEPATHFRWKEKQTSTIQFLQLDAASAESVLIGWCYSAGTKRVCRASGFKLHTRSLWSCGWCVGSIKPGTRAKILSIFFSSLSAFLSHRMLCSYYKMLYFSISDCIFVNTRRMKNPACVQSACRDWPVLVGCRPLCRCFLCCSWTLSSTRERNKIVTTQTAFHSSYPHCKCDMPVVRAYTSVVKGNVK